jgi:hypothetical protein
MPRWAGQTNPAAAAYWAGTDTPSPTRNSGDAQPPQGPEINDISQLRTAVEVAANYSAQAPALA